MVINFSISKRFVDEILFFKFQTQYAISKGLGGTMLWSFETDDLHNACGGGRFPISSAIRKTLQVSIKPMSMLF